MPTVRLLRFLSIRKKKNVALMVLCSLVFVIFLLTAKLNQLKHPASFDHTRHQLTNKDLPKNEMTKKDQAKKSKSQKETRSKIQADYRHSLPNIQPKREALIKKDLPKGGMTKKDRPKKSKAQNETRSEIKVDFKLTLPYIEPKLLSHEKTDLFIAVVVNSKAMGEVHRTLRKRIRKTWADTTVSGNKTLKWKVFFALGIADNQSDYENNLQEVYKHNDVLIGNFSEAYQNIVIKTFMSYLWTVTRLSCKYVLKTDDDVYVRVPSLIAWLLKSGSPKSFYGGNLAMFNEVVRNPKSQWYISREQYNETKFPPWCHGSYTVISSDVIPKYLIYTFKRTPFHTDDAYIGVASKDLGVKVTKIPGFTFENEFPKRKRSDKELEEAITIGHKVDYDDMIKFHNFYMRRKQQIELDNRNSTKYINKT